MYIHSRQFWMILTLGLGLGSFFALAKSPEDFLSAPATAPTSTPPKSGKPPVEGVNTTKKLGVKNPYLTATGALDTAKIHEIYLEGDFDKATKALEAHLKFNQPMTHRDSVFVFKHLGVMYAATASSREKGKYFMYQLINVEPTAKILDMYASDLIYLIFRNVQEEAERKKNQTAMASALADTNGQTEPTKTSMPTSRKATSEHEKSKTYWITGGIVLALGTAGLVYILTDSPKEKTKINTIVVQD